MLAAGSGFFETLRIPLMPPSFYTSYAQTGVAAAFVPAQHAARMAPLAALRHE